MKKHPKLSDDLTKIINIIRRKAKGDAGTLVNEMIQICCYLSFKWLGVEEAERQLTLHIKACVENQKEYEKNPLTHSGEKPGVTEEV